jgi:hypothetical protein
MTFDVRVVLAACALILASCQGTGLDSGMGGDMSPPVSQPGSMSQGGMNGGGINGIGNNNQMAGPNVGPNGQEELTNPGATLAPNEAQYPIAQGPTGMKCPMVQQFNQTYNCSLSFNMPSPSPAPSGSAGAKATAKPTASPTPTPQPSASSDSDDSDDSSDSPTPTPTPAGMMTVQMEPLPRDVPNMTNPNPLFMHITPLVAIRLQSNMDFELNGGTLVQYVLPALQFSGRVFALQLYNETSLRGKRLDQLIASYQNYTTPQSDSTQQGGTVQFQFNVPKVNVRHTQIWLLAMYGAQIPPGTTPTPSPTPSSTASPTTSP